MSKDKTRLCIALPNALLERLNEDSNKYGVPKSGIISMLLVDYYKGSASATLPPTEAEHGQSV